MELFLNDGQSCKAGQKFDVHKSHIFDPTKKITRVRVIISKGEIFFNQISFYHHQERLVTVGWSDQMVKKEKGRMVIFNIADDEQLIGCELDQCEKHLRGVTWLKIKVPKREVKPKKVNSSCLMF